MKLPDNAIVHQYIVLRCLAKCRLFCLQFSTVKSVYNSKRRLVYISRRSRRKEQNLFVRIGKRETEVTNNKILIMRWIRYASARRKGAVRFAIVRPSVRPSVRRVHKTQLYSPSKAATIKNKQNKEKEAR